MLFKLKNIKISEQDESLAMKKKPRKTLSAWFQVDDSY